MEQMEMYPPKRIGRPRKPAADLKVPVSTTIDRSTHELIQERMWQLNSIILDGVNHRLKCADRDKRILEMIDTIKIQEKAIDKLNAKIQEMTL